MTIMPSQNRLATYKTLRDLILRDHLNTVGMYQISLAIVLPLSIFIFIRFLSVQIEHGLEYVVLFYSPFALLKIIHGSIAVRYHFLPRKGILHPCCSKAIETFSMKVNGAYGLLEKELLKDEVLWLDNHTAITHTWFVKPFDFDRERFLLRKDSQLIIKQKFHWNTQYLKFYDHNEQKLLWEISDVKDCQEMCSKLKEYLPNSIIKIDSFNQNIPHI